MPRPALVAHLDRRTGQARGPHVLDRDHRARGHQLEAGLQQALFGEGVADLHRGALFLDRVVEFRAGHGRPADPVAPGLGAEIDDRHADTGGGGIEDAVCLHQPGGEGVHEAIAVIGGVKPRLAADRGHAEAVAVAADPLDHAMHEAPRLGVILLPEAQRVHRRDGPRAHGEDVAQDAAHAGGGTLRRLDIGGVVVAFHLEDHGQFLAVGAVADIHDPRVLAGPADHLRPLGRQGAQPLLRRLVGTMLVPHGRKDAELGETRLPPDDLQDALVFVGAEPVGRDQVFGDGWVGHAVRDPVPVLAPGARALFRPSPGQGKGQGDGARKACVAVSAKRAANVIEVGPVIAGMRRASRFDEAHGAEGRVVFRQLDARLQFEVVETERLGPVRRRIDKAPGKATATQVLAHREFAEVIGVPLRHGEKAGHGVPARRRITNRSSSVSFRRTSSTLIRVMEDGGSIRSAIPAKDALSRACKAAASPSRPVFVSTSETIARPRPKKRPRRISAKVQQGGNEAAVACVAPLMLK
jgi:hypothetical protein